MSDDALGGRDRAVGDRGTSCPGRPHLSGERWKKRKKEEESDSFNLKVLRENLVKSGNSGKGVRKGSLRRWPFTGHLGDKKEAELWSREGRAFQAERTASVRALGQEGVPAGSRTRRSQGSWREVRERPGLWGGAGNY